MSGVFASIPAIAVGRQTVVVIGGKQRPPSLQLPEIAQTLRGLRLAFGLAQDWENQRRQNANNGDDDQQLDQRERVALTGHCPWIRLCTPPHKALWPGTSFLH